MNHWNQGVDGGACGRRAARPWSEAGRAQGGGVVRRAFTLIELLVVVGIIAVLIGILLPTLGGVHNRARKAQTQSLMSNLRTNIDAYYLHFGAYPGPLDASKTTDKDKPKISGTQNLMLGLTYTMGGKPSTLSVPGTAMYVQLSGTEPLASGPLDYAMTDPAGNATQLPPYFRPTSGQTFEFYKGKTSATYNALGYSNTFTLPVVVDAFQDGLPILYYRRTPGNENATSAAAYNSTNPCGYYFNENIEYTTPTQKDPKTNNPFLKATSGELCLSNPDFDSKAFNKLVSVDGTDSGNVRGGYVLISAGLDRWFGERTTTSPKGPSDDLVIVGGE